MENGSFVISLDFEMMWGGVDTYKPEAYGASHVANVRTAVKGMLSLFEKYHVRATFGTVGLLMLKGKEEALRRKPRFLPNYEQKDLSPYNNHYIANIKDEDASLYFAPDLVELLRKSPSVEIGSHTFSHYYCWAAGQTKAAFEADMERAVEVAREHGVELESIIFPRNNVRADYLDVCAVHGLKCYRGNAKKFFKPTTTKFSTAKQRLCRLLDTYVSLGGHASFSEEELDRTQMPLNIPASRILKPYDHRFAPFEGLKIRRIKNEMLYAAKHGEMYHLWWHPHNFGADLEKNLANLEEILTHYERLHKTLGMQSLSMSDFFHAFIQK